MSAALVSVLYREGVSSNIIDKVLKAFSNISIALGNKENKNGGVFRLRSLKSLLSSINQRSIIMSSIRYYPICMKCGEMNDHDLMCCYKCGTYLFKNGNVSECRFCENVKGNVYDPSIPPCNHYNVFAFEGATFIPPMVVLEDLLKNRFDFVLPPFHSVLYVRKSCSVC